MFYHKNPAENLAALPADKPFPAR